MVSNLYTIKVVNKSNEELPITLKLLDVKGRITMVGASPVAPPNDLAQDAFFVEIPEDQLESAKTSIDIGVFSGDRLLEEVETTFMGPGPKIQEEHHDDD
jgi:hypothetical protein